MAARWIHAGELLIQALILFSLVSFAIETLPDLSPRVLRALEIAEAVTVGVFTIEYLLRVAFARDRLRFIFSPMGLIDLLAILPFYVALGVDLRSVRALRLIRLVRILKLARYNKAVRRFRRAIFVAKEEIVLFLGVTALLLYFAAVGIYYFEHDAQPEQFASVFHSLWWSVTTLTTVGYGDVYPVTVGGRIFTFFVLLIGLGIVSIPTGIVSSALLQAREMEETEKDPIAKTDA
ncbi:MAG TPA: ion transporter [Pirellulaceae bacterium]|jgi:voltage-gated potassium channel|nr:ion transporter [Pirellulaceae bacterium]